MRFWIAFLALAERIGVPIRVVLHFRFDQNFTPAKIPGAAPVG
jgi:hypothetical protein